MGLCNRILEKKSHEFEQNQRSSSWDAERRTLFSFFVCKLQIPRAKSLVPIRANKANKVLRIPSQKPNPPIIATGIALAGEKWQFA